MNTKVVAIIIVGILAVSSVGAIVLLTNGNNSNGGRTVSPSEFDGGYFDIVDASSLSICTVSNSQPDSAVQSTSSSAKGSSAAMMPVGGSIYSNVTYDDFHNELHKTVKDEQSEKVQFYKEESDMEKDSNSYDMADGNIVYLEKFGSLYLMIFYTQELKNIYNHLAYENYDVWINDGTMLFYMVDCNTGKIFSVTGLWCGCTGWMYEGTNDLTPSAIYLGSYDGEEYFKVNNEGEMYKTKDPQGTFRNIEGVVAFKSDGENLTYRLVVADEDAMRWRYLYTDDHNENIWERIDGKVKRFGYDMKLYENGLVRYMEATSGNADDAFQTISGDYYIMTVSGTPVLLDEWVEFSNYLCREMTFYNTYFPATMDRYESDGTINHIVLTPEESYRLAFLNHYDGCIYREVTENSTIMYLLRTTKTDGVITGNVDKLELKNTREYVLDEDIFDVVIPMKSRSHFTEYPVGDVDFIVHNGEIFYSQINWTYTRLALNTGVMLSDHCLYGNDGTVMKEFNLLTGETRSIDIPADTVTKVRVDENGHVYVEGYGDDRYCKLDLGDGGFQLSRSSVQVMTLKKVLNNN